LLVAGGWHGGGPSADAEIYDRGPGSMPAWRPTLKSVTSPLEAGESLSAVGSRLQGVSEASGGHGVHSSSTDHPLLKLLRLDNAQTRFLLPSASGWSDTTFASVPVTGFPAGHALVTVFSNGIPSVSKIVRIAP
jgi:hypothetical protein